MTGAIVTGALGALGSIWGGVKAARAAQKARNIIKEQRRDNKNWYDREYNADATQRADAQSLLTATEEAIKRRNRAAAGSAAVMGGTEESVAAAKAAGNQALSNTTAQIAANAAGRKDRIQNAYRGADAAYAGQLHNIENQRAQNITNAIQGVSNAAGGIVGAIYGNKDKKKDNEDNKENQ